MKPLLRCWAEVDLDALRENLSWIRHQVGPGVRIMTVVKADAYGHGLRSIAAHLMRCGTDLFGVANLVEAAAIRAVGRGWPVLMLGACLPDEMDRALKDGVMVTISSLAEARELSRRAARLALTAGVHVKIDTGMGRLGATSGEAVGLVREVARLPGLRLEGVMSHFASSEDDAAFTRRQLRRLDQVLGELARAELSVPVVHTANSGGLLRHPESWHQLVRPGLLVYGVSPVGPRNPRSSLARRMRPALSFKTRVSLVREVDAGTTISYGHTFTAPERMRVAVLAAGYGDGYPRSASGKARVLIRGRACRVVGRVTMDQTVVDASGLRGVAVGDEAVFVGAQGGKVITAGQLAAWCGTIPWEILTGISYRVPRVYRGAQAS